MEHVADDIEQQDKAQTPARRPTRRRKLGWGFVLAGLAIVGAIIYLVVANTGASAEYYMNINELRACASCANQTVRVAGIVAPNSIVRNDATQTIHFTIAQGSLTMPVVYNGIVPDTFRAGIQVVAEGHLVHGVFQADNVLAKCPSKFQSATPGATGSSAG